MDAAAGNVEELLSDFAEEALTSLRALPGHLESYRQRPDDVEPINAVFRTVHSVKGNASFFGLLGIKTFAHVLENTLDDMRTRQFPLSEELQRQLVASFDQLDEMVSRAAAGEVELEQPPRCDELLASIAQLVGQAGPESQEIDQIKRLLAVLENLDLPQMPAPREWLREAATNSFPQVLELLAEDKELRDAAQNANSESSQGPTPADVAVMQWQPVGIDLTDRLSAVLELFLAFDRGEFDEPIGAQFIEQARGLAAWATAENRPQLAAALDSAAATYAAISGSTVDLDGYLLAGLWEGLWPELVKLTASEPESPAAPTAAADKPADQSSSAAKGTAESGNSRLVRVKEERLDEFLSQVARLFITGEMLKDLQSRMVESGEMRPLVEELRQIIRSFAEQATALQKGLFSLRRVTVAGLFSKFPRMARTLAQQLGKQVDVELIGEDVELDKALIEDLDAPLTHILRNAVDHGLELPEVRAARGVSETGRVTLAAELTRTHARIIVTDDGNGIDPNKLRKKALEKELFTFEQLQAMSDEDAVQLIFHPGFSTAEKLSDISGRGVGLDVVRTSVRKHNGDVFVSSQLGVGTTFRLEVPLREAVIVIDGLMVRHSEQDFVVPFEFIREIAQVDGAELQGVHGSPVATIRGAVYDAKPLGSILDLPQPRISDKGLLSAVLVGAPQGEFCLLVDQVKGNRKVVVNSITDIMPDTNKIAGVAQLGGGRLALVLSIPEIVKSFAAGRTTLPA